MKFTHNRYSSPMLRQAGLTLIELLVAMSTGLLIVLAATAALIVSQDGFRSVDSSTELRDRDRFAVDFVTRLAIQAGYQDYGSTTSTLRSTAQLVGQDPEPDVFGWNNAVYKQPGSLALSTDTQITNGNRPGNCSVSDTSCVNGSDVLVIRFQGATSAIDATKSDNSMINCLGQGEMSVASGNYDQRSINILHVTRSANGEPSLSCSYYNFASGNWVGPTPMIEGVETFQVLYGTDAVTPGTASGAAGDTIVDRWLRADQLTVPGDAAATRENWRRVRAVRVGLVLRGPVGSAQQSIATTLNPLGSLYVSSGDTGSSLNVAADQRLRTQSSFTVHLRNDLTLR